MRSSTSPSSCRSRCAALIETSALEGADCIEDEALETADLRPESRRWIERCPLANQCPRCSTPVKEVAHGSIGRRRGFTGKLLLGKTHEHAVFVEHKRVRSAIADH